MPPPSSLYLPLRCSFRISFLPATPLPLRPKPYPSSSSLSPRPSPKPSFHPFSASPPTSFPYSLPQNPDPNPNDDEEDDDDDDEELVIGDCVVFEEGAFEDADPFDRTQPRGRKPLAKAAEGPDAECLVPEKWREAAEELKLSKKEKRKIAQELRFGSRMERRRKSPRPDAEEYAAYQELKLSQLNPVVLDNPKEFPKEVEVASPRVEEGNSLGGRVIPRNPKLGLGGGSLEDIANFFSSGNYVPGENNDDKKPQGARKLFTWEEKVLLNNRRPNLAEATSSKWLPLHTLAASGEFYLLDMLLKHNVDINAVDKDGLAAIHKAILCKKQAIVNYLLRNSANPFIRDRDGATLIHYAVQTASIPTIKILLLYNVDLNLPDHDGWTPLHLAVQTLRTDTVRLLLIKGADKTLKNRDGLTPLDLCLYSGHDTRTYELIKLLKEVPMSKSVT